MPAQNPISSAMIKTSIVMGHIPPDLTCSDIAHYACTKQSSTPCEPYVTTPYPYDATSCQDLLDEQFTIHCGFPVAKLVLAAQADLPPALQAKSMTGFCYVLVMTSATGTVIITSVSVKIWR